jgi:hypothetical protein
VGEDRGQRRAKFAQSDHANPHVSRIIGVKARAARLSGAQDLLATQRTS